MKDSREIFRKQILNELSYSGNIGLIEMSDFYTIANKRQLDLFEKFLRRRKLKEAWRLVQRVTHTRLMDMGSKEL